MRKAIKYLSSNKGFPFYDIFIKVLKNSMHTYLENLTNIFSDCLITGMFHGLLKGADVCPIF